MTNSIHIIYDDDAYEAQMNSGALITIWRVDNNDSHNSPKLVAWRHLPIDLQHQIENTAIRRYGFFDPNGA